MYGNIPNASPFELEVRVRAGTSLDFALAHAKRKAAELGMRKINFNFNGINFSISNKCDIDLLLEKYNKDIENKTIKELYTA